MIMTLIGSNNFEITGEYLPYGCHHEHRAPTIGLLRAIQFLLYFFLRRMVAGADFVKHGLTLFPVWVNSNIYYNVWNEITYPFPNFMGATQFTGR